jgi:putative membrane protein
VSIAGYGSGGESEGGPSASTVMPVAARVVVLRLAQDLLRGEDAGGDDGDDDGKVEVDPDVVRTSPPPDRARWLEPVGRRFLGAGLGADVAVAREGRFTRRTHVVRHARVQSLRLAQGPLQRALGLADVHLDSPPGPVHVRFRHRAADDARVLLDQEQLLARAARAARSARAVRAAR